MHLNRHNNSSPECSVGRETAANSRGCQSYCWRIQFTFDLTWLSVDWGLEALVSGMIIPLQKHYSLHSLSYLIFFSTDGHKRYLPKNRCWWIWAVFLDQTCWQLSGYPYWVKLLTTGFYSYIISEQYQQAIILKVPKNQTNWIIPVHPPPNHLSYTNHRTKNQLPMKSMNFFSFCWSLAFAIVNVFSNLPDSL